MSFLLIGDLKIVLIKTIPKLQKTWPYTKINKPKPLGNGVLKLQRRTSCKRQEVKQVHNYFHIMDLFEHEYLISDAKRNFTGIKNSSFVERNGEGIFVVAYTYILLIINICVFRAYLLIDTTV